MSKIIFTLAIIILVLLESSENVAKEKFLLEQNSSQKVVRVHLCISFIRCLHAFVRTSRLVSFCLEISYEHFRTRWTTLLPFGSRIATLDIRLLFVTTTLEPGVRSHKSYSGWCGSSIDHINAGSSRSRPISPSDFCDDVRYMSEC